MKITIDVDCTPEEARRFMGLPDVAPMQEAVLQEMRDRLLQGLAAMEPAELMKTWLPTGVESWQEMQKTFWTQVRSAGGPGGETT